MVYKLIEKENLPEIKVKQILKELTVKPYVSGDYSDPLTQTYKVYKTLENGNILIPGYYQSREKIKSISQEGTEINVNFNSSLRDYQKTPGESILDNLKNNNSGICCLYTGWGKTCLAIWLICQLKVKTLIVVHTEALMDQWIEKIKIFTGETSGILRQNMEITENKNIILGTVQSVVSRNYDTKDIGFLIIDETHHYSTRTFSQIFYKIPCKYSLGLTATLNRKDKMEKVVKWFLGEVLIDIKQLTQTPNIETLFFEQEEYTEILNRAGKVNMPRMISDLSENETRNDLLVCKINELILQNRNILVLSDRRNHCVNLNKRLSSISGLYLGRMTKEQLEETNKKQVIFATYQMASEGYDNPKLDTLILATPKSNIEQCCGRILRQINANTALIIDIIDPFSIFNLLYFARMRFYRKKKFNILGNAESKPQEDPSDINDNGCLL